MIAFLYSKLFNNDAMGFVVERQFFTNIFKPSYGGIPGIFPPWGHFIFVYSSTVTLSCEVNVKKVCIYLFLHLNRRIGVACRTQRQENVVLAIVIKR